MRRLAMFLLGLLVGRLLLTAIEATTPDSPRVLFIGDSLSRGAYATNHAATYVGRVVAALGTAERALVQSVRDLPGAEAAWARAGGQGWDLVVLEIGINDTIDGALIDDWRQRYAALVATMAPARAICVTPFDIGVERLAADLAARAAAIRSTPGCTVADVHAATLGRAELRASEGDLTMHDTGVAADDLHPNDAGHALVAEIILAALRPSLYLPSL
jgi:acyl-CoA thioesterase-1